MKTYKDINGKEQAISSLKANYRFVFESLIERIEKAGYDYSISVKKDKAIRNNESNTYYVMFALNSNTEETTGIGIRMGMNCAAFKNGKLTDEPIRINKNCEWSPKALFI
jgi:hypothetical protein